MGIHILVTGTIASGKTTLAKKLADTFSIEHIGIDQVRQDVADQTSFNSRKFNDQRHYENYLNKAARMTFYRKISSEDEGVFECSGFAKDFVPMLMDLEIPVLHLHITCPIEEVLRRIKVRIKAGYKWPPVPDWWTEDSEDQFEALSRSARYMSIQPFPKPVNDPPDYTFHRISSGQKNPKEIFKWAKELVNNHGDTYMDQFEENEDYDNQDPWDNFFEDYAD